MSEGESEDLSGDVVMMALDVADIGVVDPLPAVDEPGDLVAPPPAAGALAHLALGDVGKRVCVSILGFGEILWYNVSEARREFCGYCHHETHIKRPADDDYYSPENDKPKACRKSRTALAGKRAFYGRPLGFLESWLLDQGSYSCCYDHVHLHDRYSRDARLHGREFLKSVVGAEILFTLERPKGGDESSEPDHFE